MIQELKPIEHLLVYDLVRQAGMDVGDWSNYAKPHAPAANPRYCYEWAFEASDRIVVCLWYGEMREDSSGVYQSLNYRAISASRRQWNPTQRKRAGRMDHALQLSKSRNLPIRVIIVDGSRRGDNEETASKVERRLLDPIPWFVASYDDEGNCRLQRGAPTEPTNIIPFESISGADADRFARIAYNSSGWKHPTGEAGDHESGETYNAQNKFGHEDWLFRAEWVLDGWRYAFIQGLNKGRESYLGQPLNLTLYTIEPDERRRLVATIYRIESLSDKQADDALDVFREMGWLQTMQEEVRNVGGNADALGAPEWAPNVLNVRFRAVDVEMHAPDSYLTDDEWLKKRHRYMLYKMEPLDRERLEKNHASRRGTQSAPSVGRLFRRGINPTTYTPEHARMQTKLLAELQDEHGKEHVWLERDFVDVCVETANMRIFFEIKSDLEPRAVIRQALGQILEYAYHPTRSGKQPDRLVIVGRTQLESHDLEYLQTLRQSFNLPLDYRVVSI